MKYLLFVITTVLLTFISQKTSAQVSSNTLENSPTLAVPDSIGVYQINKDEKEKETNLTPEQQGFTKIILPSGDIVYRKQENNIIIEYRPK